MTIFHIPDKQAKNPSSRTHILALPGSQGAGKSRIPSRYFSFSRILHRILVKSRIPKIPFQTLNELWRPSKMNQKAVYRQSFQHHVTIENEVFLRFLAFCFTFRYFLRDVFQACFAKLQLDKYYELKILCVWRPRSPARIVWVNDVLFVRFLTYKNILWTQEVSQSRGIAKFHF